MSRTKYVGGKAGMFHVVKSGRKPHLKTYCGRVLNGATLSEDDPTPESVCAQCYESRVKSHPTIPQDSIMGGTGVGM